MSEEKPKIVYHTGIWEMQPFPQFHLAEYDNGEIIITSVIRRPKKGLWQQISIQEKYNGVNQCVAISKFIESALVILYSSNEDFKHRCGSKWTYKNEANEITGEIAVSRKEKFILDNNDIYPLWEYRDKIKAKIGKKLREKQEQISKL